MKTKGLGGDNHNTATSHVEGTSALKLQAGGHHNFWIYALGGDKLFLSHMGAYIGEAPWSLQLTVRLAYLSALLRQTHLFTFSKGMA